MEPYEQKKQLLYRLQQETQAQMQAIEKEDVDLFLRHVEICSEIIQQIERVDSVGEQLDPTLQQELQDTIVSIIKIREQMNPKLVLFRDKLRKLAVNEKRNDTIRQGYGNEHMHAPSIFFDKKN